MEKKMNHLEIVQADLEALYIGNLNTVEFDLQLPTEGKLGSKITWESGHDGIIKNDGKVIRPNYGKGTRTISLHATAEYGDAKETRTFKVTVLEEENKIKVTKAYLTELTVQKDKQFCLPMVAVVETEEDGAISHTVQWEGNEPRIYEKTGIYTINGVLSDTSIPVEAKVIVVDQAVTGIRKPAEVAGFFPKGQVILEDGSSCIEAQNRNLQFLLIVDDDQMLFNFRKAAGLDTKGAPEMIGWDSPDCLLRGHTTGHYLSALAQCYQATGNAKIRCKAEYMVEALQQCQKAFGSMPGYCEGFLSGYSQEQFDRLEQFTRYPEIWAPYYTLHKILAGLLDCWRILGSEPALEIAEGLGTWTYNRLNKLPQATLMKMWALYIAGEFGGMNESLAELYCITGKKEFLEAAKLFDNDKLFVPMKNKIDTLGGMHANQHIPQILGTMKMFEGSGELAYYEISEFFWNAVVRAHTYSIGGTGEGEMFQRAGRIGDALSDSTAETCASYNMLKLTAELFRYKPDVKYMDYYERTMLNHILASGEHAPTGGSTYFMPLTHGHGKTFDVQNTCCHGTGMENHSKYGECIYFCSKDTLYVNLFIPSTLNWDEKETNIHLVADERKPGSFRLSIEKSATFALKIRVPYWCENQYHVKINGEPVKTTVDKIGYIHVERNWNSSDVIEVEFKCSLRIEHTPDKNGLVTVAYGPYMLAALTDSDHFIEINSDNLENRFQKQGEELRFLYKEDGIVFIPLHLVEHQKYQIYVINR